MRSLALSVAIAVLASAAPASAQPRADTVAIRTRDGDSYALLAAEYYGDRKHARFILLENGIKQPRPLRPGTLLRIPVAREIVTSPGDTFAKLADTYLGDAKRDHWLAQWNGMKADESLAAGVAIVVPFTVTYTPQAAESLGAIAAAYLGSASHADLLRRYNFLDEGELDKGHAITIPAFHVKLQPAKLRGGDDKARERRELARTTQQRAIEALPRARHAWRVGEFARVKDELAELELDYLTEEVAIAVGVLLGSAHVAFGEEVAAKAVFARLLDRKPSHQLRSFEHSPKVLAVWKQAAESQ